ncbi:MAG: tetraacyldisaccharide 4'-kinase [Nitrospinae bacterium]|nr:tetraacyldisaccharide 4'-kinase [Nitrospinota bacterium]
MSSGVSRIRRRVEDVMRGLEPAGSLLVPLVIARAVYGSLVWLRNWLYDSGILVQRKAPLKVMSVGNLTIGGSGKTPFVELLARKLSNRRIGILSRGYGSQNKEPVSVVSDGEKLSAPPPLSADEPYMMAKNLPGVPVVCAPKRIDGAVMMAERFGLEGVILDDGFQHRAIHRDLDILLINSDNPFGDGRLFPTGILREPVDQARRAGLIVITGAGNGTENIIREIRRHNHTAPVIRASGSITGFSDIKGVERDVRGLKTLLFCGVAGPKLFLRSVEESGATVLRAMTFADHHNYTDSQIGEISAEAASCGAQAIVTTEKDMARLAGREKMFGGQLLSARYKMRITDGENILDEELDRVFGK